MNNRLYRPAVKALALILFAALATASVASALLAVVCYSAAAQADSAFDMARVVMSHTARDSNAPGRIFSAYVDCFLNGGGTQAQRQEQFEALLSSLDRTNLTYQVGQSAPGAVSFYTADLDTADRLQQIQGRAYGTYQEGDAFIGAHTFDITDDAGNAQSVTVRLYVQQGLPVRDAYARIDQGAALLFPVYTALPYLTVGGALTAAALLIFLLCAAGRRYGQPDVAVGPLDRVFLEVPLFVLGILAGLYLFTFYQAFSYWTYRVTLFVPLTVGVTAGFFALALLSAAVLMTVAVRVKTGTFLRSCLLGWAVLLALRLLRAAGRFLLKAGKALGGALSRFGQSVPLCWPLGLAALLAGPCYLFPVYTFARYHSGIAMPYWLILALATAVAAVLFGAQLHRLFEGARAMRQGQTDAKIDLSHLHGPLRAHGETLNALGESMDRAVAERMKSERLKTELITNVSHDIRTPLTSIINFLDLMRDEPDADKRAQYLQTAAKHAQRLKKMTDDLIEASKAATGNVPVALTPCAVGELFSQCMGEYGPRLEQAGLTGVVRAPEGCAVLADGALLWRVMDNLLNNACKYGLSGTRLYLEAVPEAGRVTLSVRNISRQELDVSAEELMERFVRGDRTRATEGSGLGLNIAKSLTELMHGEFTLAIRGDLFECCIRLPEARIPSGPSVPGNAARLPLKDFDSLPVEPALRESANL